MTQVLRPLSLGELLDRVFQLYRRHFLVFTGIVALPYLLLLPLQLGMAWQRNGQAPNFAAIGTGILLSLAGLLMLAIAQAATVVAVSRVYLGQTASIVDSYSRVAPQTLRLLLLFFVVGLLLVFGYMLLILPGIFLTIRWSLTVPVTVLENASLGESMGRSAHLVEGDWVRVFAIYFLYFVAAMIFSTLWQIPTFAAIVSAGRTMVQPPFWTQIVIVVGSFLEKCLVGPLITIALALVYYDERVRKEAFDLEHLLTQLDGSTSGDVVPA